MSTAFYVKKADQIYPLFGVNSTEEAKQFVIPEDHRRIVESDERIFMNLQTGSVDFESNWRSELGRCDDLVQVTYSPIEESWLEVEEPRAETTTQ